MVHLYSAYPMALALYNGNKTHMSIYIFKTPAYAPKHTWGEGGGEGGILSFILQLHTEWLTLSDRY